MPDSQTTDWPPAGIQKRFPCNSGDGSTLIVDVSIDLDGDVVIQCSGKMNWVTISADTARAVASAIMDCATAAELGAQHEQA